MTIEQAHKELLEEGFEITKVNDNQFIVVDNGKFGFCEDVEPFIIDGEELLEIHEQYLN